jgi:membrane fusion protein, multidrug efflux system
MGRVHFFQIAIFSLLLPGCRPTEHASAPAPAPPAVGVRIAATENVAPSFNFVGRIEAVNTVQLRARVEGFLEKMLFTEGQHVKAGDLLYQIEKTQYLAAVDQAKANLAAAEAQALNAKLQYDRSAELIKTQNVPQATVDKNLAALDSAQASVLQNKAALTLAEENLGYTDIYSPIDGRISITNYTIGNLVNPASGTLATVVSEDPIYVTFPVGMSQIAGILTAHPQNDNRSMNIQIYVKLADQTEYPYPGVWNYTGNQVQQQTDTVTMRGTLPNPQWRLVDGQFVTVEVKKDKQSPRIVVPKSALQFDQAGSYVLIVGKENKVEVRRVKAGEGLEVNIVIDSGLEAGATVIVEGIQKVRPGEIVRATALPAEQDLQQ